LATVADPFNQILGYFGSLSFGFR